jgi:predicted DNA-binding protein
MRSINTSLRIPVDLHEQLVELAEKTGVGVRAIVMEACREKVKAARKTMDVINIDELSDMVATSFGGSNGTS